MFLNAPKQHVAFARRRVVVLLEWVVNRWSPVHRRSERATAVGGAATGHVQTKKQLTQVE